MRQDSTRGQATEAPQGAVRATEWHVAHSPPGFASGSAPDHLVIVKQGRVEKHNVSSIEPLRQGFVQICRSRNVDQPPVVADDLDPDIDAALGRDGDHPAC